MGTLSTLFRISSGIRHQALDFQVESRQFTSRQDCVFCVFWFCLCFLLLGQADIFVNGALQFACGLSTLRLFTNSCIELALLPQQSRPYTGSVHSCRVPWDLEF